MTPTPWLLPGLSATSRDRRENKSFPTRIDFTQNKADCLRIFAESVTDAIFCSQRKKLKIKEKLSAI
jgi:hypothetical protein